VKNPYFCEKLGIMNTHIRTFILDDDPSSTDWLSSMLTEIPYISVIAVENNAVKAIKKIIELKPDLIFTDIEMPVYSGFDVIRLINEANRFPKVVFITAYQKYAIKAIKFMAFDYLLKPIDIDELRNTLIKLKIKKNGKSKLHIPELKLIESLTNREEDVLRLLIEGCTSTEISRELFISKSTVDSHRKNILLKTQARNTAELVVWGALDYFF